jgi:hypothetical protein
MAKKPKPQPIPTDYATFLNLAQTDEDFRQALYAVQNTKKGDAPYDTIYNALIGRGVTPNDAKHYLDQIVKIDWKPMYQMEQALGRLPDAENFIMG